MITEKDLLNYGFKKNEGDSAIIMPYEMELFEEMYLCVTMLRNKPEFCIHTPDGILYLQVKNLDELKIIEQSIVAYEEN